MGLFGKKKEKKTPQLQEFRIYMNASGRWADGAKKTEIIQEDCEFSAIRAAEKMNPRLKVCRAEKVLTAAE